METAYRAATPSLTSQRSPRPASDAGLSTAPRRSVGKPPLRQHAFALSDGKPFMHALLREARHADRARRSFVAPLPASPIPNIRQAAALAFRKIWTLRRYLASGRGRHYYDRTAGVVGGVWRRVGVRTQLRGPRSGPLPVRSSRFSTSTSNTRECFERCGQPASTVRRSFGRSSTMWPNICSGKRLRNETFANRFVPSAKEGSRPNDNRRRPSELRSRQPPWQFTWPPSSI